MQALADRLQPYEATRVVPMGRSGLWSALQAVIDGDATVLPPDPVSDARVAEICADEAQRAIFNHLAALQASGSGWTESPEVIDLTTPR